MTASKNSTSRDFVDPDDAPDMSTQEWTSRFDPKRVMRGRPTQGVTKVSTTIRLDRDVVESFRADGPGWNTRINAVLRADMMKRDKSRTRG